MSESVNIGHYWGILTSHWIILASVNLSILAVIIFLFYKYLFSRKGEWIREKLPFLQKMSTQNDVKDLLDEGEYAKAGDLLISTRRYKEAINVFKQGNLFGRAADVYLLSNQLEQAAGFYEAASDFEKAAELYVQIKAFEKAEKCFIKLGKEDEIPSLYQKHNLQNLAAQSMVKLGQFEKAAKNFVDSGEFDKAGDMISEFYKSEKKRSEKDGYYTDDGKLQQLAKQAGNYYDKGKLFVKAAEMFLFEKLYVEAGSSFENAGKPDEAIECFMKAEDFEKAANIIRKTGDTKRAAFVEAEGASQAGDDLKAVKLYQEAGNFAKAGDIYRNLQEYEKAGIMFEKAKEFSLAASAYADAEIYDRAAQCSERTKNFDKAIEYYGKASDYARQVTLQEKLGKFLGAGLNYYQRGLLDEALNSLNQVKENTPDYKQALSLIGKIHMEKGDFSNAKLNLENAIKNERSISKNNIETFTNLALLSEQTDSDPGVLKKIEKLLLEDLVDNDVKERVKSLKEKLSYFQISRLSSKVASKTGTPKFGDPQIMVSNVAKMEKKRYVKIKEIGRGGMGIVYTAKDTTLDRVVALKILPSALKKNPQAVKIFLREAKSAASLSHPNIVTVFDAGVEDEDYYIAMELINGLTIKEILQKNKKLSLKSVFEILRQVLPGLIYAHKMKIVHRDLTTNNIMWSKEKQIKIMDFGLAKVVKDLLSEQSIIGGTPSFMSPEQTLGKPIDHRADIYSLGICIYQMLLGELPFKKGDIGYHHIHTQPPVPKNLDKNIPDVLNTIILKCMEKDPINRFQSGEEISALLVKELAKYKK